MIARGKGGVSPDTPKRPHEMILELKYRDISKDPAGHL